MRNWWDLFYIPKKENTAYNSGTGVIETYRGQKLTRQLYDFILPVLKEKGIEKIMLEVITENAPAIHSYEIIGFRKIRKVVCYQGEVDGEKNAAIREMEDDWELFASFWNWPPTWQNSIQTLRNLDNQHHTIGFFEQEKLCGYASYSDSGRVAQIAVHPDYRRQGIGRSLLGYIRSVIGKKLTLINYDEEAGTMAFIKKWDWQKR